MSDLITSISTAITIAKRLNEIGKNIQDAEFKNLLADLSLELADTKLKLSEVVSENAELKEEVAAIKHSKSLGGELVFRDQMYYTQDGDGPFCPGCYDTKGAKIRTPEQKGHGSHFGKYRCPSCNNFYG